MKKLIIIFLLTLTTASLFAAPDTIITIRESELIEIIDNRVKEAVNLAVKEAVAIVVKEYENKLIDKQKEIVDLTALKKIAEADAKKYKDFYEVEQSKQSGRIITYIIIGASGLVAGTGVGYFLFGL